MADLLPWFMPGPLHFTCTGCGDCCRRPGLVFVQPKEADRIAERLEGKGSAAEELEGSLWERYADGAWVMDVRPGGACPLLSPQGCTVHDIKPIQCATYPFWPEILQSPESWAAEARWCEGISRDGRPYDGPAIRDLLLEAGRTAESAQPRREDADIAKDA